jgi:multimeric flavodoxin WrbA
MTAVAKAKGVKPKVVEGQVAKFITREEFRKRFETNFFDPAFDAARKEVAKLETIAWDAYKDGRKSPKTAKAGRGFADPSYQLSIEWRATRDHLRKLEAIQKKSTTKSRVLVICGSPRNDGSCPGEMSKTWRLAQITKRQIESAGMEVDVLDLSLITNEYAKHIHPCKGCVSTAMPLCHWPCSCYPNYALSEVNDWMAEIYAKWTAAHGVLLVTPVHWYQTPSVLKSMIDRLVCADGGNPDPSSTHGKKAVEAKQIELAGWDYPKHLAGRVYGVVVHGDVAGIEGVRRALSDWLDWMGLIEAGSLSRLDRFVGYYEPYATSHQTLDKDRVFQEEVRNVARGVVETIRNVRAGKHRMADDMLVDPRKK